jgi:dolichol-phosphate mannosyltransferase
MTNLDNNDVDTNANGIHNHQTALPSEKIANKGIELSIIIPTFNEKENVQEIIKRIESCMHSYAWEIIFVDDDSPDGTVDEVRKIAQSDSRIRCIQRIGRRGLSSACIEGMLSSSAPYLAVIDGDLQHDEALLPTMLMELKQLDIDIISGSRYMDGGSIGAWDDSRHTISRLATKLSRFVVKAELSDPMSGYFMIRREVLTESAHKLSAIGFKILLDIIASTSRPLKIKELPYVFRCRHEGESKMDTNAAWNYMMMLFDKRIGHLIPVRFIAFTAVGGMGVLVHLLTLSLFFNGLGISFIISQSIATLVAMTFNFTLNNILTYRDMSLKGKEWFFGWLSFILACSIGAISNVGVASFLFGTHTGWFVAALSGVFVGSVWNYAITSVYTWKKPKSS